MLVAGISSVRGTYIVISLLTTLTIFSIITGWWLALEKLKINGPYQQIVTVKDLVADILPPPEYIIEPYLVISKVREAGPDDIDRLETVLTKLKKDFDDRVCGQRWHFPMFPCTGLAASARVGGDMGEAEPVGEADCSHIYRLSTTLNTSSGV